MAIDVKTRVHIRQRIKLAAMPKTEKNKTFIGMKFVMSRLILLLENNMKYNNLKGLLFTSMLFFYKVLQNGSTFNTY